MDIFNLSMSIDLQSFGLYIHNDTVQPLGRSENMFQIAQFNLSLCSLYEYKVLVLINVNLTTLNSYKDKSFNIR